MSQPPHRLQRTTLVRDVAILYIKILLDGMRGAALLPAAVTAAAVDFVFAPRRSWFYRVLGVSERFDLWLNLYAARNARADADGLFGASTAGSDSLLGWLEQRTRGGDAADAHQPATVASR